MNFICCVFIRVVCFHNFYLELLQDPWIMNGFNFSFVSLYLCHYFLKLKCLYTPFNIFENEACIKKIHEILFNSVYSEMNLSINTSAFHFLKYLRIFCM